MANSREIIKKAEPLYNSLVNLTLHPRTRARYVKNLDLLRNLQSSDQPVDIAKMNKIANKINLVAIQKEIDKLYVIAHHQGLSTLVELKKYYTPQDHQMMSNEFSKASEKAVYKQSFYDLMKHIRTLGARLEQRRQSDFYQFDSGTIIAGANLFSVDLGTGAGPELFEKEVKHTPKYQELNPSRFYSLSSNPMLLIKEKEHVLSPAQIARQNLIKQITASRAMAKKLYEKLGDLYPKERQVYYRLSEKLSANFNSKKQDMPCGRYTPAELQGLKDLIKELEIKVTNAPKIALKPEALKQREEKRPNNVSKINPSTLKTVSNPIQELELKQRLNYGYAYLAAKFSFALASSNLPTITDEDRIFYTSSGYSSLNALSLISQMSFDELNLQLPQLARLLFMMLEIARNHHLLQGFTLFPELLHTRDLSILPLKEILELMIPFVLDLEYQLLVLDSKKATSPNETVIHCGMFSASTHTTDTSTTASTAAASNNVTPSLRQNLSNPSGGSG